MSKQIIKVLNPRQIEVYGETLNISIYNDRHLKFFEGFLQNNIGFMIDEKSFIINTIAIDVKDEEIDVFFNDKSVVMLGKPKGITSIENLRSMMEDVIKSIMLAMGCFLLQGLNDKAEETKDIDLLLTIFMFKMQVNDMMAEVKKWNTWKNTELQTTTSWIKDLTFVDWMEKVEGEEIVNLGTDVVEGETLEFGQIE